MKVRSIVLCIFLFLNIVIILFFSPLCTAKEANIIFKDVTVELTKTRPPVGTTTIREYRITATVENIGDTDSVNITMKMKDPQPGLNATLIFQPESYSLAPNEEKSFVFENWPTSLSGDIILNISFKPASPNVLEDSTNTRSYFYTLHIGSNKPKTSTPGFEVLFVLIAVIILLFIRHNRKLG